MRSASWLVTVLFLLPFACIAPDVDLKQSLILSVNGLAGGDAIAVTVGGGSGGGGGTGLVIVTFSLGP